ncbi:MAG: hypothetical protein RDV48_18685 [Candidatus Eremiobacteraeota bacterium]|nr:hypothetical protein [Candidatus Eremiobacteraeota bacterium]
MAHRIPGSPLTVKARLHRPGEGKRNILQEMRDFVMHGLVMRQLSLWEPSKGHDSAPLVKLMPSALSSREPSPGEKIISLFSDPLEYSFTQRRMTGFMAKTVACLLLFGSILTPGSPGEKAQQGKESQAAMKHQAEISDCPLSFRFAEKAYAAVDCVSTSDSHTFELVKSLNHTNSSYTHQNSTPHTNSHTNSNPGPMPGPPP